MAASYRLETAKDVRQGREVRFYFNGQTLTGYENEPIAAALIANGITAIRIDEKTGQPRGIYCGIGHCYECRAEVDGKSSVRTCLTPVREGTTIITTTSISDCEERTDES
ncbi:(2Fe-2S)-binding protein [Alicyclobacillus curvatus]|nr:(2Fe-2S)-binding protein [Alicyclobacillus curvatus]